MTSRYKRKGEHGDPEYDKVYTDVKVMEGIMQTAEVLGFFVGIEAFVDPTAGDGRLRDFIPSGIQYVASDADPQSDWIAVSDYKEVLYTGDPDGLVVGFNPPFGYQGRGAKEYVEWVVTNLRPKRMVLILPHIVEGWLPDGYRPIYYEDHHNIFSHGVTRRRVPVNVRIYLFVRERGYLHPFDLRDKFKCPENLGVEVRSIVSKSLEPCVPPMVRPVLWIKRTGERSGRVVLLDTGCKNWFFMEPDAMWTVVVPADIGKSMRLTGSWIQVWGVDIGILVKMGEYFVENTPEEEVFMSGSTLSSRQKNGALPIQCAKHKIWKFLQ